MRPTRCRNIAPRFSTPAPRYGREPVYFCGNSLGLMPDTAQTELAEVIGSWQTRGVAGHFDGPNPWLNYHERARGPLARLTGAGASEVVAMNSLTANLHFLMASFYQPQPERDAVVIEAGAFPSDRYAALSQLEWHGITADRLLVWQADEDGLLHVETLLALLEEQGSRIALVLLPGVQYATGQRLPIAEITAACHRHGVVAGFDLAHAIGNVPLALHEDNVDFAVWCSYKYLNSGPGAVGGAFVHERHHASSLPRLAGWWGNRTATRFLMRDSIDPAAGADGWQLSNPPILALAPLVASLAVFDDAGMDALRAKSIELTGYFSNLLERWFADELVIQTPAAAAERGAQLSLSVPADRAAARRLYDALEAMDVVGDWREPNILRYAPAPLYNSFADVAEFCLRLDDALVGL